MPKLTDQFSQASNAYRDFRPDYPEALYRYLATLSPSTELVWDCGCGNGQASIALADHFDRVFATDISDNQIAHATSRPNITYRVSPAEHVALHDSSVDLVTVAQAIHWFDHSRFFAEVSRVLKPGGVLAAWGYQLLHTGTALDDIVAEFHSQVIGPYWPKGRELLDEGYTKIPLPYPREKTPAFSMEKQWHFDHLIGYLNTWSAVKSYEADTGRNPVSLYSDRFLQAWGAPESEKPVSWPLILYVGIKSA
ncbi:class I SAM-dependent methyltransferase [Aurantivibrio plasticivorans]